MASAVNMRVNGGKLTTVQSFKYLGSIVTDEGSMPEIRSRIAQTIAALTKLRIIWDDKKHRPQLKDQTVALLGHVHISILLCDLDINSRNREKDTDSGNEKFQTSP